MSNRLAHFVIALIVLLTAGAISQIPKLGFDYEFEHFFPTDDPELEQYHAFKERFDTDIDFVIIGIRNDEGIFDSTFLQRADSFAVELKSLPHVKRIISPFNAMDFALGPFGPIGIPYLHPDDPSRYAQDSTKIYKYGKQVGSLFSPDGNSISMLMVMSDTLNKLETDTVYYKFQEVVARYDFDEFHAAGKPIGQAYYIDKIKQEFSLFIAIAIVLITVVLILIYRSFWGTMVPLIVVLLSVIWLLGLMSIVGKSIDIMTTLLPLVLFVVGVSDVIHLLSRFFEEIRAGMSKRDAIQVAYRRIGTATFLTSLTTAMGFLTLLTSGVRPVRELGMYAAIGVFIAFFLAFSLLPAILTISKVPKLAYKEPSTVFWNALVIKILRFSMVRRTAILLGSTAVLVIALAGISKIEIDNYLLEDVSEDDPIRASFAFFEEHFAGVRPFELQYVVDSSAASTDVLSPAGIEEMQAVESYLLETYQVGFLNSPLDIVRAANQALNGGLDRERIIPEDTNDLKRAVRLVNRLAKRPEFTALISKDRHYARFSAKIEDRGGLVSKRKDDSLMVHFDKHLAHGTVVLTGMSRLIDQNNETLSKNMMSGLIFALLVVAIIMGLLFKSIRLALISLIPNVLPLVVVGGVMGWSGIDLKITTSIIFGIAFGIAVDDSIHYLSKYKQELVKGRKNIYAIKRTSLSTGKAIILTSVILIAGFGSLSFSEFTSTFYVGCLISISLVAAVVADLVLLPLLLAMLGRSNKSNRIKKL